MNGDVKYIKSLISEIIDEQIDNAILLEDSSYINDNNVVGIRKEIENRVKQQIDNEDESIMAILDELGYDKEYNAAQNLDDRRRLFANTMVSNEISDDILRVASILKRYTDNGGNVYIKRNERNDVDTSKRHYLEDDFSTEETNLILRLKAFMDMNGLTILYDKTANAPTRSYGIKDGDENLDFNNITDTEAKSYASGKMIEDEARFKIRQKIVTDYMNAKYGMEIKIPEINLSNGNAKIPNTTLIINFDSAVGCPAWNECLVKHACYARSGEKRHPNIYKSNKSKSILWRQTQSDPQLLTLLLNLVRAYCFNYDKIAKEIISLKLTKGRSFKTLAMKMANMSLTDSFFTPQIIDIVKKHKRIENIRLNENGDFIGQWLVDAWDNMAGELKICGINVSAYTCRHLNFNGIKNIILNTSFKTNNNAISRNFIAVPDDVYDALDETYGGPNNSLVIDNKNDSINPNIQPLYSVTVRNGMQIMGQPNGSYYYKCPCGRNISGSDKVSCYQCSLCYEPNNSDKTVIVFVKAHGSGKNLLSRTTINDFGISENYLKNYKLKMVESTINEYVYRPNNKVDLRRARNLGIKMITNNAVNSLYGKLGLKKE